MQRVIFSAIMKCMQIIISSTNIGQYIGSLDLFLKFVISGNINLR